MGGAPPFQSGRTIGSQKGACQSRVLSVLLRSVRLRGPIGPPPDGVQNGLFTHPETRTVHSRRPYRRRATHPFARRAHCTHRHGKRAITERASRPAGICSVVPWKASAQRQRGLRSPLTPLRSLAFADGSAIPAGLPEPPWISGFRGCLGLRHPVLNLRPAYGATDAMLRGTSASTNPLTFGSQGAETAQQTRVQAKDA